MGEDLVSVIVCDGMGGARAGNVASRLAVEAACAYLEGLALPELLAAPGEHLARAAALANESVFYKAVQDPACRGMGTTMVAMLVHGRQVEILNIGDSRAYRVSGNGIAKVTRDHSVVEDLIHRGDLTPEQARIHPQKNLITRALGSEQQARTDLYHLETCSGEFFLLCTDGLSNTLTDQELLYEILYGGAPETCCQRMLDISLSRGAPDNVTAVLIQIM